MANRFKSKRSESVVNQRPQETSGIPSVSNNTITHPGTTKSGGRVSKTGKGSTTTRAPSRGKQEGVKYVTQPIQYVVNAKHSSALGHFPNTGPIDSELDYAQMLEHSNQQWLNT